MSSLFFSGVLHWWIDQGRCISLCMLGNIWRVYGQLLNTCLSDSYECNEASLALAYFKHLGGSPCTENNEFLQRGVGALKSMLFYNVLVNISTFARILCIEVFVISV